MMRLAVLASLGVTFLAACNGTEPTASGACAQVVAARCQRLAACSPADLTKRYGDEPTCEARQTLTCLASLSAPDTGATPSTVITCADTIPTMACADFLTGDVSDACLPATGHRQQGQACGFNGQCASQFCAIASDSTCGTCQPTPIAGASCADNGCGPNMVCVASSQMCETPVIASGACSDAMPCAAGLACVGADSGTGVMGTCAAEGETAGAACDPKRKTAADCDANAGLTCDTTTNMCVTQPIVAAGMTCGNVNGVATRCNDGATCIRPPSSQEGTCVAGAADGAACDTVNGPDCLGPAKCVPSSPGGTTGTCTLPGNPVCM